MSREEKIIKYQNGAVAGEVRGRYDLVPPEAVGKVAHIMAENAERHGDTDSWRKLKRQDQVNRALAHLFQHQMGLNDEDHLGHALCRLMFANSTLEEDAPLTRSDRKRVYVCHPYYSYGDHNVNLMTVGTWSKDFFTKYGHNHTAVVPHFAFRFIQETPQNRSDALEWCKSLLRGCDLLLVISPVISFGMYFELRHAMLNGIPIYVYSEGPTPAKDMVFGSSFDHTFHEVGGMGIMAQLKSKGYDVKNPEVCDANG